MLGLIALLLDKWFTCEHNGKYTANEARMWLM